MNIRRRTGLILVGIACAVLIVLIVLVPTLLNADRYRTKVISRSNCSEKMRSRSWPR
jgi:uncharacterized membrane protein YgaE (UPF0421/DUF939 family)